MTIKIHIELEFDGQPDGREAAILAALGGSTPKPSAVSQPEPVPAEEAPKKRGPGRPRKEETAPKPEPEPEPEVVQDEGPKPEPEAEDTHDLKEAVKLATKLVSEGRAKDVKTALGEVGAKKVSELSGDQISDFIKALS